MATTTTTTTMATRAAATTTTIMAASLTYMAPIAVTSTSTAISSAERDELALFVWLSPAFPVGAFAYSHGLEWAVEDGDIHDAESLLNWLRDLADHGAPNMDARLFAASYRAAADATRLREINELAIALAGSAERRLETSAQGAAFLAAARAAWDNEALARLPPAGGDPVAYAVAVGAACAGRGFRLDIALPAFVVAVFANLVSAATRLSAIGQTDGQRVLAALLPRLAALALGCADGDLSKLGNCAFRSDLAAIRHETQYSRLFRS